MKRKIKQLGKYGYRTIELLLVLLITYSIFVIGTKSYDRCQMTDALSMLIFGLLWCWFIYLPFIIIIIASFIRAIPPRTIYKKMNLALHIFNIVLWFVFYFSLSQPLPCDAAIMEDHYKKHKDDMHELISYVRSAIDDSCAIRLNYRDDKIQELSIGNHSQKQWWHYTDVKDISQYDSLLNKIGITAEEMTMINEKMRKAGVLGIDIDKKSMSNFESGNTLLFRWYGANSYLFSLYDHPVTKEVKQDILSLHQFILYNDSVVFESFGGYPGGRGFPDRNNYH